MALRNVVNTVSRGLVSLSSVRHIYFNRSLSSSLSAPKDYIKQAPKQTPTSTKGETSSGPDPTPTKTKTVAQADAELRERLERMSGEGGAAGIEYEDGKPSAMKRGVRNNMFRVI